VLAVAQGTALIRILGETGAISLRASGVKKLVPGHLVTVHIDRRWSTRGEGYASGRIEDVRIDVAGLGLEPLPLEGRTSRIFGRSTRATTTLVIRTPPFGRGSPPSRAGRTSSMTSHGEGSSTKPEVPISYRYPRGDSVRWIGARGRSIGDRHHRWMW
jgi:hypothetical protein